MVGILSPLVHNRWLQDLIKEYLSFLTDKIIYIIITINTINNSWMDYLNNMCKWSKFEWSESFQNIIENLCLSSLFPMSKNKEALLISVSRSINLDVFKVSQNEFSKISCSCFEWLSFRWFVSCKLFRNWLKIASEPITNFFLSNTVKLITKGINEIIGLLNRGFSRGRSIIVLIFSSEGVSTSYIYIDFSLDDHLALNLHNGILKNERAGIAVTDDLSFTSGVSVYSHCTSTIDLIIIHILNILHNSPIINNSKILKR